jgi:hypothetical protein
MSIDRYYTQIDGRWVRTNIRAINKSSEPISDGQRSDFHTEFWVDICHGGNVLIDERYYFEDLASALDFYLDGWRDREFVLEDGERLDLSHSGLYSRGRLIHGRSIHGDAPGHESENLRRICEVLANNRDADDQDQEHLTA